MSRSISIYTIQVLLILLITILQPVIITPTSYMNAGSGSLGPYRTRCISINAFADDSVSLHVSSSNYSIEVGVVFLDNYPDSELPTDFVLNSFECMIYDTGIDMIFDFTIPEDGKWGLVIHNPRNYSIQISYEWRGEYSFLRTLSIYSSYLGPPIIGVIILISGMVWYQRTKRKRAIS